MNETENLPTLGLGDKKRCPKCEGATFTLYRFHESSTWVFECVKCHTAITCQVQSIKMLDSFEFTPNSDDENV